MRDKIAKIINTVFGIGFLPLMPGTYASAAGCALYFLMRDHALLQLAVAAITTSTGFAAAGRAEALFKKKDPKEVVIDELCGMLIAYLYLPYSLSTLVLGFFIFRAMDILKVFPANRLERLPGSLGIMLDDISAGIMTNIILRVISYLHA